MSQPVRKKFGGKIYFYCERCRRKFMFEKTYAEHRCKQVERPTFYYPAPPRS